MHDDNPDKVERWTQRLRDAVAVNRVDPERAEAIARRVGAPPLNPSPSFDPMGAARWSLPMAVAWIAWKRLEIVRDLARESRADRWHWRAQLAMGKAIVGWRLEELSDPDVSLSRLGLEEAVLIVEEGEHLRGTWRPAMVALWQALGRGDLDAVGYSEDGTFAAIKPYEWHELVELVSSEERDALARKRFSSKLAYQGVTVPREELLRIFPLVREIDALPEPAPEPQAAPMLDAPPPAPEPIAAPEPRKRGAKKGQGAKPDAPHVQRILELERDGSARHAATVTVALELSSGSGGETVRSLEAHRRRLWRKVQHLPALPKVAELTDTK